MSFVRSCRFLYARRSSLSWNNINPPRCGEETVKPIARRCREKGNHEVTRLALWWWWRHRGAARRPDYVIDRRGPRPPQPPRTSAYAARPTPVVAAFWDDVMVATRPLMCGRRARCVRGGLNFVFIVLLFLFRCSSALVFRTLAPIGFSPSGGKSDALYACTVITPWCCLFLFLVAADFHSLARDFWRRPFAPTQP